MTDDRLSRIEHKLDQLTEVVVQLAKHDERITNLSKRQDRTEVRLDEMDKTVGFNSIVTKATRWIVGLSIAAIIGAVIRQLVVSV